jgi:molecular chaperone GrpE
MSEAKKQEEVLEEIAENEASEETLSEEEQLETDVSEADNELAKLQEELDSFKDKYARVHADFENIKKRLEKEKYQAIEYANEKFAKDMVPVLDSLEGALKAADGEAECQDLLNKMKEGIELTYKLFLNNLEKHGVERVAHDEPFDPNIHNAVQSVDHDAVESGEIVQTFQTGYKYKGRPLREAMVVVAN